MLQADHAGAAPSSTETIQDTPPIGQRIQSLCQDWSLEVTPGTAASLLDMIPSSDVNRQVYITHLPGQPFEDVIHTARRLKCQNFDPVPHLVARRVPDRNTLLRWIEQLSGDIGIDAVLLIAGGMTTPLGPYQDTLALLEDISLSEQGIRRLAIAGHPEGHPHASEATLDQALETKLDHAERDGLQPYVVTQFLFDAQPLIDWRQHLHQRGIDVPIRVGLPGPASLATLWKYALSCGIGPSVAALQHQGGKLFQLARSRPPVEQVMGLAQANDPTLSLHFYPFGGIDKTVAWCRALETGQFEPQHQDIVVKG
ncbi:methylenetetrahydrofolate reductase [Aidingimonas lacisalsi]|uniref:methylenetetrahydrofolate reductase n=1 Tax=Aidingimonas lacisalsi TaxID=2604086 RepID=UPI00137543BC|nr:methylenetetrahydrofolate reductase [Aidingimonas lacisalsi]